MQLIDWLIVLLYLIASLGLGLYLTRRGSGSLVDFFVSGRSLPWWLAGTSMAATTFSIDTPLYVAGVVGTRGIVGNWEWWSFGISHLILIYVFARLWRRSEIVTDAQLTEMRYGGRPAALLRGIKAFLFAVPINCIGIGYAMLAMVKVVDALQLWQSVGITPGDSAKLWSVVGVSLLVLLYAGFSGLWGVVATDFFQFILALVGAFIVAAYAIGEMGGMAPLLAQAQQATDIDVLAFLPFGFADGGFRWSDAAGISLTTFAAYAAVQWWSFRRSDGGGEFIQRLAASKDEAEAEKAAWFFNLLHYVIRTWPWVVVALAAIALYPTLEDRELGYPRLMLDFLPPVLLGLVVASLLAAFMSTVSTLINWGASYLTNDLYLRFIQPTASQAELVLVGRLASVLVTVLGGAAAFFAADVTTVFRLVIAIGTGPGLVLILRWFWWRINAAAELAAMLTGFVIGLLTSVVPVLRIDDFGVRLMVTSAISVLVWVSVMYLTPPESDETLDAFYAKIRPGGPGWARQRSRTGLAPAQDLRKDLLRTLAASFLLFGAMFAIGGFLLLKPITGWGALIVAVLGWVGLRKLRGDRPSLDASRIAP
ncbi:sodium:solute symporter family protein [Thermoleptolyngbya sp. C42_A2020_037]|uniref:sodium:solute symporter family protein n=1 Tax=Thermoleptolyngbya sp. C42_A2020_037 TaxID=2747799 RepID=UPI0019FB280B|nr:sodium:solute symporter family protein [Thermoleptolyngbya sp. C42_A2020_037]MBF2083307.1 Na+:solute symporter [Thermoleptolyngbya sp. C42_A2020_037]